MTVSVHRRSLRAALAACAALLVGACAPGGPSTGPSPQAEAETRLDVSAWTAQSPAAEIASWVRQGCRRAPGGRDACLERTLVGLVDQAGVAKSMEVLDTLTAVDPEIAHNAHPLAHGLGIAAYRSPETVAATFASCPVTQMSGCSHGVVQGYFLDLSRQGKPIDTAVLDALCAPHTSTSFLFFQCAHGMGHGLMAVHQNHLPMTLQACDLASDAFVRTSCYGGAFMENVVNFTHPHHTAGGHADVQGGAHGAHGQQASADAHAGHGAAPQAGHDAHAGHGAQPAAGAHAQAGHDAHAGHGAQTAMQHGPWKALDPQDLLYPCNAVALKYQQECYAMQTSPVMYFNNGDVAATARVCEQAGQFMATCFMSLGRDITAYAARDHQRTLEMCGRAGETANGNGRLWCTLGAVTTLVNFTADPADGMRFCRAVPGADPKRECYRVVGENIASIHAGNDARAQSCSTAESEFVAACRMGAGVTPASSGSDE